MMPLQGNPMPARPPENVVAYRDRRAPGVIRILEGRYTIRLHRDYGSWLSPWWATIIVGIGCPENGVKSARSRERLVAKCERYCRRDARRRGLVDEPIIRIEGP